MEILQMVLDAGADLDARDWSGRTPLGRAVVEGDADVVRVLVAAGAPVNDQGDMLHKAAWSGQARVMTALLDAGADVNARNANGESPLRYAACLARKTARNERMIRLLLDRGAEHDVFTAAAVGDAEVLRGILHSERQAARACSFGSTTALHWAARAGNADAARCLLDAGADVDAGPPDAPTPFQQATTGGHLDIAHLLLEHGANPNAHGRGRPCLSMAQATGDKEMVKLLRKHGAEN
jgi:ankyrin repeat protein